jgi:hypothetical protein
MLRYSVHILNNSQHMRPPDSPSVVRAHPQFSFAALALQALPPPCAPDETLTSYRIVHTASKCAKCVALIQTTFVGCGRRSCSPCSTLAPHTAAGHGLRQALQQVTLHLPLQHVCTPHSTRDLHMRRVLRGLLLSFPPACNSLHVLPPPCAPNMTLTSLYMRPPNAPSIALTVQWFTYLLLLAPNSLSDPATSCASCSKRTS